MTISIFTQQAPKVGPFEFDAVFEDILESNTRLARYPLEIGADAADHSINEPYIYTITGGITNTPLTMGFETLETFSFFDLANLFDSAIAAQVAGLLAGFLAGSSETRASATLSALLAIQASGEPFSITTGDLTLDNMSFRSITRTRDVLTENGFEFVAVLEEQPRVATVLRQNQPNNDQLLDGDPSRTQAAPVISQGEVSPQPTTNQTFTAQIQEFFS